jgi:hypothetical protein
MKTALVLAAALFLALPPLSAADPVLKADFSTEALPEGWQGMKGEWKVVDGALTGAELESDKHAAVFSIPDPHKDSSLRFRFRLDGAKGFNLSYNHAKGHLFRVAVAGGTVTLTMDKDKKDPASKAEVLGKADFAVKPGEWVEMTCSVEGTTAKVTCGDVTLTGAHENLAKEKTGYRFIVQGASVGFDDIAFASVK